MGPAISSECVYTSTIALKYVQPVYVTNRLTDVFANSVRCSMITMPTHNIGLAQFGPLISFSSYPREACRKASRNTSSCCSIYLHYPGSGRHRSTQPRCQYLQGEILIAECKRRKIKRLMANGQMRKVQGEKHM
jgi:hypothetical protein